MTPSENPPEIPAEPIPSPIQAVDLGPIGPKERYEFTKDQEATIGDLANRMRFVGAFLFAFAGLGALQVVTAAIQTHIFDGFTTVYAIVYGLIGYWTLRASGEFSQVVETTGWDVPHVMGALSSMRKMYLLLYWILIAACVASLIMVVSFFLAKPAQ